MKPEQYIAELERLRRITENIRYRIDEAVYRMQRRLETGYSSQETESRQEVRLAHTQAAGMTRDLEELLKTKIDYE